MGFGKLVEGYDFWASQYGIKNIKDYGAKVDGVTDDTTAWLEAISANPLFIYLPPGTSLFSQQLNFGTIKVVGAGKLVSTLKCTAKLGTGVPSIISTTPGNSLAIQLQGFKLLGPGVYTLGVKTADCDGMRLDNAVKVFDCAVQLFDSGIVSNSSSGHVTLMSVSANNNYYGVYELINNGGHLYIDCDINGNTMANIAVPYTGSFLEAEIIRTHLGFAPFGIYQEAPPAGQNAGTFITELMLDHVDFEAIGNAAIYSEGATANQTYGEVVDITVEHPGYSYKAEYYLSTASHDYTVKLGYISGVFRYVGGQYPFTASVNASGVFYIGSNSGIWLGDDFSPTNVAVGGGAFPINYNGLTPPAGLLNGTTAGVLRWVEYSDHVMVPGSGYETNLKRFVCIVNGYENTTAAAQTITFPIPFGSGGNYGTAYITFQPAGFGATVNGTTLTLPANMTGAVTGLIIVEGM